MKQGLCLQCQRAGHVARNCKATFSIPQVTKIEVEETKEEEQMMIGMVSTPDF